jgi:hypothetical protein
LENKLYYKHHQQEKQLKQMSSSMLFWVSGSSARESESSPDSTEENPSFSHRIRQFGNVTIFLNFLIV